MTNLVAVGSYGAPEASCLRLASVFELQKDYQLVVVLSQKSIQRRLSWRCLREELE